MPVTFLACLDVDAFSRGSLDKGIVPAAVGVQLLEINTANSVPKCRHS